MRSLDGWRTLFAKEVRSLLAGRALWVLLMILSALTGYSFIQAVNIFSQASQTALQFPELARGMTPLDGVMVPTFGALYLAVTLLFPFVAIRLIGDETQSGGLKLLLQSRYHLAQIVAVKLAALGLGWLLTLIPVFSAMGIWLGLGGHISLPEFLNLLMGYTLYALIIAAIAFFASAFTESNSTAAIVTLTFTLGSWVLDFAAGSQGWMRVLSALSLTTSLRSVERGLFSLPQTLQVLFTALGLLALCVVWLHPGTPTASKLGRSAGLLVLIGILLALTSPLRLYSDLSEDRRNSFNPADERALRQMTEPLTITIYLSQQDSRLKDLERSVLPVLRRTVPHLTINYAATGDINLLGGTANDKYGLIMYDYAGRHDESRSTSTGEILPILYTLSGQTVTPDPLPEYPGYPLVANPQAAGFWFYAALPALFGILWWRTQAIPKQKGTQTK